MEDGVAALKAGAAKLAADSTLLRGGRLKALAHSGCRLPRSTTRSCASRPRAH